MTLAFIRGLALLQKKQYPQAAGWFQLSLKNASDFLGAAFYLGAVHAAAGRDNDAIGAWQMATIGEDSEAVYPMLVDALLRIGDAAGCARHDRRSAGSLAERRRADCGASPPRRRCSDSSSPALEALNACCSAVLTITDLLFVAIQVLYRQHLAAAARAAADRQRFDQYTQALSRREGARVAARADLAALRDALRVGRRRSAHSAPAFAHRRRRGQFRAAKSRAARAQLSTFAGRRRKLSARAVSRLEL